MIETKISTQWGLKEWASVVEHIGQGKQLFAIRNSFPKPDKFILYPTFSYYSKILNQPELLDSYFKPQFSEFVKQTSEATLRLAKEDMYVKVEYWVECDPTNILKVKGKEKWKALDSYHIWNNNHVLDYINDDTSLLWILRVHKFDEPQMLGRIPGGGPPTWYKHPVEIELTKSKPVLSDTEFYKILEKIKSII